MRRHEVTDPQWELVKDFFTPARNTVRGRPCRDRRTLLNGMMWILRTGAPWRDLPDRFGPWQTVYHHFNRWRADGVFDQILAALQMRLDAEGRIDWDLWCVDGSSIRASRAAAGAQKKAHDGSPTSRPITRWVAREAGLEPNSIWSLTARACR